ncbi:serine/threonine protein kinase [Nostoc flagelliforme FACHB-838]|uniref:non-specific serine/threonine protein kinase n=1 Tax=Nostoc flagelliforme FACHB-838 TaxID=2692904 RepID=A0ABR8E3E6_9NOSO|nr:serine/threonine-protein kinase [Nostoc flagelliforme]MBD2535602.1 serine/threonine protein kinase [Nostoc flagelliforme FACHB-838]
MLNQLLTGRYKILKVLGAGGFGQTYIAQDIHRPGNPTCVVKHLKPANAEPAFLKSARYLFEKEAEALEKLGHHSQIPRLLAYFEEKQEFFLVQELIEGNVLCSELLLNHPWSESQVVQLLREILEILDFVHSNGVIHRDVKPNNIIRRQQDNKLVLVDFGIVKQINMQLATVQSQMSTSIVVGSLGYMSPEQVRGKPRFSSDIYALGIIAIQAITGLNHQQLKEDANGEIDWQRYAQASPQLAGILSKMVRYHFQERYESAKEVLAVLESLVVELGYAITQPDLSSRYSQTEPVTNFDNVPVSPFGQNLNITSVGNNYQPLTSPTFNLFVSQQSSELRGFARIITLIKSPLGVTLSLITFANIFAVFTLDWHKTQKLLASVQDVKSLKQIKEYEKCIKRGNDFSLIANKSLIYKQAKTELLSTLNECRILQAKTIATNLNFSEAIKQAAQVPANQPFSQDAQNLINEWSRKVITQATQKYENLGDVNNAIIIARTIPPKSDNFIKAQKLIDEWQKDFNNNKKQLQAAQGALAKNEFDDAITSANKISDTQYWQEQKEAIIQEAKSSLKQDNPKTSAPSHVKSVRSKIISPKIPNSRSEGKKSNSNPSSKVPNSRSKRKKLNSSPSYKKSRSVMRKRNSESQLPFTSEPSIIETCESSDCQDNSI